jgi:S-adenosylmethionine:tRNA ribosyltransferase-isomerase
MRVSDLDYELPEALVAQEPLAERDEARLLVLDRSTGRIEHRVVSDLPSLVAPSLFVVNDTRVIPARLMGRRATGGRVELLLVERTTEPGSTERWSAMGRASKPLREGTEIEIDGGALRATVIERGEDGALAIELVAEERVEDAVRRAGRVPLPPYIRRADRDGDRDRYQTMFAAKDGAIAAPTAGLHFTPRLVDALTSHGHRLARVTLHVGPGTFRPVKVEDLAEHPMHAERYEIGEDAAGEVSAARREARPIVAVGTTVVRTLESAAQGGGVRAGPGITDLFVRPPFTFRCVDALVTNFHLPRSTLLALVMAFGGVDAVRAAYEEAVRERYRFFSYGDAMLIREGTP